MEKVEGDRKYPECRNLGFPENANEDDALEPFMDDKNGFSRDSVAFDVYKRKTANDHSPGESYEAALVAIRDGDLLAEEFDMYTCLHCGHVFVNPKRYLIHFKWHSFGVTPEPVAEPPPPPVRRTRAEFAFRCDPCRISFKTKHGLKSHALRTHDKKPSRCTLCLRTFTNVGCLRNHMRTHRGDRRYHCIHCPKRFKLPDALKKHMLKHVPVKSFKSKALLKAYKKAPENGKPFKCPLCPKTYIKVFNLKEHEKTHVGKRLPRNECDQCGERFRYKYTLKKHTNEVHNKNGVKRRTEVECTQCKRMFVSKNALHSHVRQTHLKGKLFKCSVCPKTFISKFETVTHEKKAHKNHIIRGDPVNGGDGVPETNHEDVPCEQEESRVNGDRARAQPSPDKPKKQKSAKSKPKADLIAKEEA